MRKSLFIFAFVVFMFARAYAVTEQTRVYVFVAGNAQGTIRSTFTFNIYSRDKDEPGFAWNDWKTRARLLSRVNEQISGTGGPNISVDVVEALPANLNLTGLQINQYRDFGNGVGGNEAAFRTVYIQAYYFGADGSLSSHWGEPMAVNLGVPPDDFKVTFTIPVNTTERIIRYEVYQSGVVVGSLTVGPGEGGGPSTFNLSGAQQAELREVSPNMVQASDGSWRFGESDFVRNVATGTPVPRSGPDAPVSNVTKPTEATAAGTKPPPATVSGGAPGGGVVWKGPESVGGTDAETGQDGKPTGGGGMTIAAFREGVDVIASKLEAIKNVQGGSSGGVVADAVTNATLNSRAQELGAKVDALKAPLESTAANTLTVKQFADVVTAQATSASTAFASSESARQAKQQEGRALIDSLGGSTVGSPLQTGSSGGGSWELTIAGYTFNLDPANHSVLVEAAAWFKTLVIWTSLGVYYWWVFGEIRKFAVDVYQTPQAKGNPVVGGTGGQVTALAAAGVVTAIIFTAIPTVWAAGVTVAGFSVTDFWTGATSVWQASASIPGRVIYLLNFFLPMAFLGQLIGHVFLFRKTALGIQVAVMTGIKWSVP